MLHQLKEAGVVLKALHPAVNKTIYESDMTVPVALIIGSEGKGVRKHILKLCDEIISLPLRGRVKSLNASVAGAISVYETLRQRL
jgi:23S rRNA (guanosine2251-2'-O)-methyltransferase